MIGKYLKLIVAVACVFVFALSLTVSLTQTASACTECCWRYCIEEGRVRGLLVGSWCNTSPTTCCYINEGCI
jgi:hypothetical protein